MLQLPVFSSLTINTFSSFFMYAFYCAITFFFVAFHVFFHFQLCIGKCGEGEDMARYREEGGWASIAAAAIRLFMSFLCFPTLLCSPPLLSLYIYSFLPQPSPPSSSSSSLLLPLPTNQHTHFHLCICLDGWGLRRLTIAFLPSSILLRQPLSSFIFPHSWASSIFSIPILQPFLLHHWQR